MKELEIPLFLVINNEGIVTESARELPDFTDDAVFEMIKLTRQLKAALQGEGEGTTESPAKRPKLCAGQRPEQGRPDEPSSRFTPLFDELEEMFQRHSALFEWADGPVAIAMKTGDMLLLDELSLAEDAVLERLNSVLEPSRTLVLAEKGEDRADIDSDSRVIRAHCEFRVFATMNPGGDFGKRELSPALRSRFTEIWVPPVDDRRDVELVLARCLDVADAEVGSNDLLQKMLAYVEWFNHSICKDPTSPYPGLILSLRDVLSWAHFIIKAREANSDICVAEAYCHGAALMHLDGLGLGTGLSLQETAHLNARARVFLSKQSGSGSVKAFSIDGSNLRFEAYGGMFGFDPFWIQTGQRFVAQSSFNFQAPKTAENVHRVLRAMQLSKPILLEGTVSFLCAKRSNPAAFSLTQPSSALTIRRPRCGKN
jgi:midasin